MDLLPSARSIQKYLSRHLPEAITSRLSCLASEERRIGEVSWLPIAAAEFVALHDDRQRSNQLTIEFKAVEKCDVAYPQDVALLPANAEKNAHKVLPYDQNRIILRSLLNSDVSEDYVNASLIEGYNNRTYIAAQGPVACTINDFWQMVWQQGVEVIVMLTDLFSYSKQQCEKYWHNTYNLYGDVHVKQDRATVACHYTFRRFHISKVGHVERAVDHWQFHNWDEHGLPDMSAVLELRRKVKQCATSKHLPVVVHCSDGSGRTGTFIALDVIMDKLEEEGIVDIINTVRYLRTFRQKMVSGVAQYKFLYNALSSYLRCGTTVLSVSHLAFEAMASSGTATKTRINRIEKEFETLANVVPKVKVSDCAAGHRAENHSKSRDLMIQAPERSRPYLMTFDSNDNSDYYNAVYINGHRRINELIVTQWPLSCTVNDFWRLVYDCHVSTVVVLHDESTSQSYPRFWPDIKGVKQRFGPISSTLLGSETRDCLVLKSFAVKKGYACMDPSAGAAQIIGCTETRTLGHEKAIVNPSDMGTYGNEMKQVKIIFLSKGMWPDSQETPAPLSASSSSCVVATRSGLIVELLLATRSWQDGSSSHSSPVLVMSRDGVSRAGIFCSASIIYERLLDEDEVDVFSAVKYAKENRPQLVGTLVEYSYCYTVATDLAVAYMALVKDVAASSTRTGLGQGERCTAIPDLPTSLNYLSDRLRGPPLCTQEDDGVSRTDDTAGQTDSSPSDSSSAIELQNIQKTGGAKEAGRSTSDSHAPRGLPCSGSGSSRSSAPTCSDHQRLGVTEHLQNAPLTALGTTVSRDRCGKERKGLEAPPHRQQQQQPPPQQHSATGLTCKAACTHEHEQAESRRTNQQARDGEVERQGCVCSVASDGGSSSNALAGETHSRTTAFVQEHSHELQNGHLRNQQKNCEAIRQSIT